MSVPVTRAAEGLGRRAFTIADVERLVEIGVLGSDERLELLGGDIVPMASTGPDHEMITSALSLRWGRSCPADYAFACMAGLRLDQRTCLKPDFIVFERSVGFANVQGTDVLLAVEVADISLSYDLGRKALLYAIFGVHELWVIDAISLVVHRHLDPAPGGYSRIDLVDAAERLVPARVPAGFGFALDEIATI